MNVRNAVVRAVRTGAQSLAAGLLGLPLVHSVADVKVTGSLVLVAIFVAGIAAAVSFLQNLAEDASDASIPKG